MHVKDIDHGDPTSRFRKNPALLVRFFRRTVHRRLERCSGLITFWRKVRGMGGVRTGPVPSARCPSQNNRIGSVAAGVVLPVLVFRLSRQFDSKGMAP